MFDFFVAWLMFWITAMLFLLVRYLAYRKPTVRQKPEKKPVVRIKTIHERAEEIAREFEERANVAESIAEETTREQLMRQISERFRKQMRDLLK